MYIPGDYWIICDRCGFKVRRSNSRKEWTGALVCKKCWEPRHPQDFVKAKADKQAVPDPRPDTQTMLATTRVKVAGSEGDSTIDVNSISGISDNDSIGITLDSGTVQWTTVDGTPSGDTVTLADSLDGDAAVGNTVYIPGDDFLSTNEVSQDDL